MPSKAMLTMNPLCQLLRLCDSALLQLRRCHMPHCYSPTSFCVTSLIRFWSRPLIYVFEWSDLNRWPWTVSHFRPLDLAGVFLAGLLVTSFLLVLFSISLCCFPFSLHTLNLPSFLTFLHCWCYIPILYPFNFMHSFICSFSLCEGLCGGALRL